MFVVMWTGEMVASDRVGDMEHRGWASWRAKIPFLSLAHCKKADDLTTSGGFNPEALERGAKVREECRGMFDLGERTSERAKEESSNTYIQRERETL